MRVTYSITLLEGRQCLINWLLGRIICNLTSTLFDAFLGSIWKSVMGPAQPVPCIANIMYTDLLDRRALQIHSLPSEDLNLINKSVLCCLWLKWKVMTCFVEKNEIGRKLNNENKRCVVKYMARASENQNIRSRAKHPIKHWHCFSSNLQIHISNECQ